jgi:hypothetical protein
VSGETWPPRLPWPPPGTHAVAGGVIGAYELAGAIAFGQEGQVHVGDLKAIRIRRLRDDVTAVVLFEAGVPLVELHVLGDSDLARAVRRALAAYGLGGRPPGSSLDRDELLNRGRDALHSGKRPSLRLVAEFIPTSADTVGRAVRHYWRRADLYWAEVRRMDMLRDP